MAERRERGGYVGQDRSGEHGWGLRHRFGVGEQPRYFGTARHADGRAGFGGGYGRQGFDEDYGAPPYDYGTQSDWRPDHTSRRAHGENPFGYYGQYRDSASRDRFYSGGYDEGRVSTWRPDLARRYRRGPKGYRRSDERIREDLSDRLMQSEYIDSSEVTVEVAAGKVMLGGTVPERRMKHAIEDLAESCAGVQDVENRIRVQRE